MGFIHYVAAPVLTVRSIRVFCSNTRVHQEYIIQTYRGMYHVILARACITVQCNLIS